MALTRVSHVPATAPSIPRQPVLYVEDEDSNWEIAEKSLRDRYVLTRASTDREVFALLQGGAFKVILMDIQLSGSALNGIEITQILKGKWNGPASQWTQARSNLPVIFMTAYNARYSRDELVAAGGEELIPKPVEFTRLALAISKLLARRALDAR